LGVAFSKTTTQTFVGLFQFPKTVSLRNNSFTTAIIGSVVTWRWPAKKGGAILFCLDFFCYFFLSSMSRTSVGKKKVDSDLLFQKHLAMKYNHCLSNYRKFILLPE
jgi:hypothetical protein